MGVRSFIALELSEEVKKQLSELLEKLQRTNAAVKWVEPENLHLTLKFLGEVPQEKIEQVKSALSEIALSVSPFSFTVRGVGGFPSLSRPRVLWIGVEETPELMRLQKTVEQEMEKLGFPPEERPYHPHITIGRVKSMTGMEKVRAILTEKAKLVFGVVLVNHLILFRSDLSKEGPTYTPLAKLSFSAKV